MVERRQYSSTRYACGSLGGALSFRGVNSSFQSPSLIARDGERSQQAGPPPPPRQNNGGRASADAESTGADAGLSESCCSRGAAVALIKMGLISTPRSPRAWAAGIATPAPPLQFTKSYHRSFRMYGTINPDQFAILPKIVTLLKHRSDRSQRRYPPARQVSAASPRLR